MMWGSLVRDSWVQTVGTVGMVGTVRTVGTDRTVRTVGAVGNGQVCVWGVGAGDRGGAFLTDEALRTVGGVAAVPLAGISGVPGIGAMAGG